MACNKGAGRRIIRGVITAAVRCCLRDSGSVIYGSKLLSPSPLAPCTASVLTPRCGEYQDNGRIAVWIKITYEKVYYRSGGG